MVEDRPLAPRNGGGMHADGVEFPDRWDLLELFRTTAGPEMPNGALVMVAVDCVGDGSGDGYSEPDPRW